jgi:sugar phosphate isomerase/epimerase
MRLAAVISLSDTKFGYISKGGSWKNKVRLLSKLGYEGVELGFNQPLGIDCALLQKELKKNRLKPIALATGQAYVDGGLSLSSLNKKLRDKAISAVRDYTDTAACLDAQIIIGLIRGGGQKDKESSSSSVLLESMGVISEYALKKGVQILIEPLNRYESCFLNTAESTLAFIKELRLNRHIGILLDTFHMNIEEPDIAGAINSCRNKLFHMHIADSNRMLPGTGHIDFPSVIRALRKNKYSGYLSAEFLFLPSFEYCADRYAEIMGRICGNR